jgi:hypothetical protein
MVASICENVGISIKSFTELDTPSEISLEYIGSKIGCPEVNGLLNG